MGLVTTQSWKQDGHMQTSWSHANIVQPLLKDTSETRKPGHLTESQFYIGSPPEISILHLWGQLLWSKVCPYWNGIFMWKGVVHRYYFMVSWWSQINTRVGWNEGPVFCCQRWDTYRTLNGFMVLPFAKTGSCVRLKNESWNVWGCVAIETVIKLGCQESIY